MALAFSKIEALKFGDLTVTPHMDAEKRLRVRNLKMKEANLPTIIETLSACFGDKASEVAAFMKDNLFLMDLIQIQTYLSQGQTGLNALNDRMDKFMDKEIDKVLANKTANKETEDDAQ